MADEISFDGVRYISLSNAAKIANMSREYLADFCNAGALQGKRVGKRWYVSHAALRSFLDERARRRAERANELARIRQEEYRSRLRDDVNAASSRAAAPLARLLQEFNALKSRTLKLFLFTGGMALVLIFPLMIVFGEGPARVSTSLVVPREAVVASAASVGTIASDVVARARAIVRDWFLRDIASQLTRTTGRPTVTATISSEPSPAAEVPLSLPAPVAQGSAPATIINNPVIERIIERQRLVTQGGITSAVLDDRLGQLDDALRALIIAESGKQSAWTADVYHVVGMVGRVENLFDTNITAPSITGGTITNASISGGTLSGVSLLAGDLTGTLTITQGGTGTSTMPSFGQLLLGQADGTYALVATSSLGITSGGGTIDGSGSANLLAYFIDSDTLAATSSPTAGYFIATSTATASLFPFASTTMVTAEMASTTALIVSGAPGGFLRTDAQGTVSAQALISLTSDVIGTLGIAQGGTGTSTPAKWGDVLTFTGANYEGFATSTLGLPTFGDLTQYALASSVFGWPFPGNATSTTLAFQGGLLSTASTTIGGGTQSTGLTISGGATTTDNAYFGGGVGIGASPLSDGLRVDGGGSTGIVVEGNYGIQAVGSSIGIDACATLSICQEYGLGRIGVHGYGDDVGVVAFNENASGYGLYAAQFNASGFSIYAEGGKNYFEGNVGIGDATPAALLTVGASDAFQVNSSGRVLANVGASGAGNLSYSFVGDTDTGFYRSAENEITFQTEAKNRLIISGTGFGTTTLTGLNINGQATSTSNVGWNITTGCYAINGTCVDDGGVTGSGSAFDVAYWDGASSLTSSASFRFTGTGLTVFQNVLDSVQGVVTPTLRAGGSASDLIGKGIFDGTSLGIGTTSPYAKLAISNPATITGSELVTNGTFDTDATGWTLQSGCAVWDSGAVTVLYDATCQADAGWPALSTTIATEAGKTYLLTFDLVSNGDLMYYYFANNSESFNGPFGTGSRTVAFRTDFTGTETVTFESWNWTTDTGWSIDNVSIREAASIAPSLAVFGYDGTPWLSLGDDLRRNTALGQKTLLSNTTGTKNTALGSLALSSNTTGSFNTAVGYAALLSNTTGVQNTALGTNALLSNTTGSENTALGYQSLHSNTTGFGNTALGRSTLASNTTGARNIAVGYQSLSSNTTGSQNTALGYQSLLFNTTGVQNTALGYEALRSNTTGSYNVAFGVGTSRNVTTGYGNILLGAHTLASPTVISTGAGNIGLGNNLFFPSATANNQLNIGNFIFGTVPATSTSLAGVDLSSGRLGIGTVSPRAALEVMGDIISTGNVLLGYASPLTTFAKLEVVGKQYLTGGLALGPSPGHFDAPEKLADPATLPASTGNGAAFSPDGAYLAVAHTTSPFITIYKRSGDTFTKLADPAILPPLTGRHAAFSPDGVYLAVAHNVTPFITIYKRSGDTFTKLANPATLPGSTGNGAAFSPDGAYLAVAHDTTPFITIYKRDGDTFTKLDNPATLPASGGQDTAFSPDGVYLAVGHSNTPFITIYKRSGDTFTKLANPATLPASRGNGAAFSPDGAYLAVVHGTTPFITIYKRDGDTFTKLADPATLPASGGQDTAFSPDGVYLAVGHSNTPFITIYKRSGDTFTKLADPATLPASTGNGTAFSPDGAYLAVAHATTPFITIYKGDTNRTLSGMLDVSGSVALHGVGTSGGTLTLCLDANKQVVTNDGACTTSAEQFKEGVETLTISGTSTIAELLPSVFSYTKDPEGRTRWGFIAENLASTSPAFIDYFDAEGRPVTINTTAILAAVVKAVQELIVQFRDLAEKIARFTDRIVSKEVVAENRLCIGETCVTETELQALLQGQGLSSVAPSEPIAPIETAAPEDIETPSITPDAEPAEDSEEANDSDVEDVNEDAAIESDVDDSGPTATDEDGTDDAESVPTADAPPSAPADGASDDGESLDLEEVDRD